MEIFAIPTSKGSCGPRGRVTRGLLVARAGAGSFDPHTQGGWCVLVERFPSRPWLFHWVRHDNGCPRRTPPPSLISYLALLLF